MGVGGANGPRPPEMYGAFVKMGRGHEYKVEDEALKEESIAWLRSLPKRGLFHDPADWSNGNKLRKMIAAEDSACR